MHRRLFIASVTLVPPAVRGQMRPVARLAALADGRITLDGQQVSTPQLDSALALLSQRQGVVWYYRQNAQTEPHPNAMAAIALVMKHRLPVSMSTKPDFSDYVDENGQVKPRR